MSGIERIQIIGGKLKQDDWRVRLPNDHAPLVNQIYRSIFKLAEGDIVTQVSRYSEKGKMDGDKGIDIILSYPNGDTTTLQEKILTKGYQTLTVETFKKSGGRGAWYYCQAKYYFVGYTREYGETGKDGIFRLYDDSVIDIQDWVLVDWPQLRNDTSIKWHPPRKNAHDNRGADFKWIHFYEIPKHCIVASKGINYNQQSIIFLGNFTVTLTFANPHNETSHIMTKWLLKQASDMLKKERGHDTLIFIIEGKEIPFPNHPINYSVRLINDIMRLVEGYASVTVDNLT